MQFSTINESSLHHTVKLLYSESEGGDTEVSLDGHVYDIFDKENDTVIEIQTKNLSQLVRKVKDALDKGHKVKIVHTIPLTTEILLYDVNSELIKKSMSTNKYCIYDLFNELTKIYPYILNPNFSLDILEIHMKEIRVKVDEKVQSKNGRRRFKKDWLKKDKMLKEIVSTRTLKTKEDYLSLLPSSLPEEFSNKDFQAILKGEKLAPYRMYKNCGIVFWVLSRMNLIVPTKMEKRSQYYKINRT